MPSASSATANATPPSVARRSHSLGTWKRRIDPDWPGTIIRVSVSSARSFGLGTRAASLAARVAADAQQELSHPQLVALHEQLAVLPHAVDQRPVRAAEVLHEDLRALVAEQRVRARDGRLVQHQVRIAAAADHGAGAVELPLQPL